MEDILEQEMRAWEALGMKAANEVFNKLHDHGWVKLENGFVAPLPSGEVGEICKTCGKVIEPFSLSVQRGFKLTHEP